MSQKLKTAFLKTSPEIKPGDINPYNTQNRVKIAAAALTELVHCPDPENCQICKFCTAHRNECIRLKCACNTY